MFIELVLIGNNTSTILTTPTKQTCRNKYKRVTPMLCSVENKLLKIFSRMSIANCHCKSNLPPPALPLPKHW